LFYNTTTKEFTYNPVTSAVTTFATSTVTSNATNSYDCTSSQIFYVDMAGATGNWGINLANLTVSNSAVAVVTLLLDPGGAGAPLFTPYDVFQINGSNTSVRWTNGVQPPIIAGFINALSYSILNNGGNLLVLGSSTDYT
jgi:hypothetical protein